MKHILKRAIAFLLVLTMVTGTVGCSHKKKKEPKPEPKATAVVNDGNTNAKGKGGGQSDIPLVIGTSKLKGQFNPFAAKTAPDMQAVNLTQAYLISDDRSGQIIYKGIDGEVKTFHDKDYTYYGPANVAVRYKKKQNVTVYTITLSDNMHFSDGEQVTIDDVIFTMYAFCDNDYKGNVKLGVQPIKGLLNYQANNSAAEKFTAKKVSKYIKKMPLKLKNRLKKMGIKKSDDGYRQAVEREARKLMASAVKSKKKTKKVKNISGIRRINDYKMTLTTKGYDKNTIYSLKIPICPLHYYGDTAKYNYAKNKFGFKRNDISTLRANKTSPVGAGPYRFVKHEKDIVYYTSNEIYYKGCPKIAYVQLKEMKKTIQATQKKIDEALAAASNGNTEEKAVDKTAMPKDNKENEGADGKVQNDAQEKEKDDTQSAEDINGSAYVTELSEGTVDILDVPSDSDTMSWIEKANSNGKLSGNKVVTRFTPTGKYQYIGINARNVKVGKAALSKQSYYLRKALATAINSYKRDIERQYGYSTKVIEYPYSSDSWILPQSDAYSEAYRMDIKGESIYDNDTEAKDKDENVKNTVLDYLKAAGYQIEEGKVTKAPKGAKRTYTIEVPGGEKHVMYEMITEASELLKEIGMKLNVVYNTCGTISKAEKMSVELWCADRNISQQNGLYNYYADDTQFAVKGPKFNRLFIRADKTVKDSRRQALYQKIFDSVRDMAVEIPVNELQTAAIYSSARINMDTMTPDVTLYYDWTEEIQNVEMK